MMGTLGGISGLPPTKGISRGPSGRNDPLLEADCGEYDWGRDRNSPFSELGLLKAAKRSDRSAGFGLTAGFMLDDCKGRESCKDWPGALRGGLGICNLCACDRRRWSPDWGCTPDLALSSSMICRTSSIFPAMPCIVLQSVLWRCSQLFLVSQ